MSDLEAPALRCEAATLRAALQPFADKAAQFSAQPNGLVTIQMDFAHFRDAAAALRARASVAAQQEDPS